MLHALGRPARRAVRHPAMRELFKLGPERTACAENIVRRQVRGSCVADDAFPNHAWLHRAPAKD